MKACLTAEINIICPSKLETTFCATTEKTLPHYFWNKPIYCLGPGFTNDLLI